MTGLKKKKRQSTEAVIGKQPPTEESVEQLVDKLVPGGVAALLENKEQIDALEDAEKRLKRAEEDLAEGGDASTIYQKDWRSIAEEMKEVNLRLKSFRSSGDKKAEAARQKEEAATLLAEEQFPSYYTAMIAEGFGSELEEIRKESTFQGTQEELDYLIFSIKQGADNFTVVEKRLLLNL